jgi:hypothetical protein
MREKISRAFVMVTWAVGLILIWFSSNIIRWQLDIPYRPSDYPLVVWTRYCVVMLLVAIACELRWRTPLPLKDGPFWKRVYRLALLGGLVSGWLITSHFPHPTIWEWILMPFALAVFGGVQMALAGTITTAAFLHSNMNPSKQ